MIFGVRFNIFKVGVSSILANRCAVRIDPKDEFIDWINDQNINKSEGLESVIYLFDDTNKEDKFKDWFERQIPLMFKYTLSNYCEDAEKWPSVNNKELFLSWFKVEFSDMIIDLGNEPLLII
jgi:hypothetical protein